MEQPTADEPILDGEQLTTLLAALAHPQRLRIVATLAGGRNYVSQLAREMRMSRPLLHMHLARLEAASLIRSEMQVSEDGKAMRYVELTPFSVQLSPEVIAQAMQTSEWCEGGQPAQDKE